MKRLVFLAIAALTLLAACVNKSQNVPFEEVNMDTVVRDTMIYGFCSRGSDLNTLQLVTDAGDTLKLDVSTARRDSLIKGGYNLGDELAVTVNADTTAATMIVNRSVLLGNWVTPNPIDGSSFMGVSIQKGGTAESIDQSELVYKSWRLFNGKLIFMVTLEDGIGSDEAHVFSIIRLNRDSLIISGDDEIQEYGRQKLEVDDGLDIELDDGMDDFFL